MARTEQAARLRGGGWDRARATVAAVPAVAWLVGLVALSTVLRFLLARGVPSPFIFQDELLYAEMARSLGTVGHFAVRGVQSSFGVGPVYPALISPAYALFHDVPQAYTAAKAINALLMSLAAVPVYLIARRLLAPIPSLVAAVLSLSIPWLELTTKTMTENAFFPIFLFWFLALVLTLERPTVLRQLATIALLGLAYETRPQAVALVPALVTALVLVIAGEAWFGEARPRWRAALASALTFWVTWVVLVVGAALFAVVEVGIRGQSLSHSLLRAYSSLAGFHYNAWDVARWTLWEAGQLDVVVGIFPFAALLAIVLAAWSGRWTNRPLRAFAAAAFGATLWLLVTVGVFVSSPFSHRLQDRPLFYVVPLLLIALVLWAWRGVGREWPIAATAAVVAAGLAGIAPLQNFLDSNAVNDSFGLLNLIVLSGKVGIQQDDIMTPVVLGALVAGLLFLFLRGRWALLMVPLVFAFLVYGNRSVSYYIDLASRGALAAGIQAPRDWVDRATPKNAHVALLFTGARDTLVVWENEYFNRSVDTVWATNGPMDTLPQTVVAIDPGTGVVKALGGAAVRSRYVLTDSAHFLVGRPIAEDQGVGMRLYRVHGPVRVAGSLSGIYPDTWSGPSVAFAGNGCHGGSLSMRLTGDEALQPRAQTVVARAGKRVLARIRVRPGQSGVPFVVPLPHVNRLCTVAITVSPTAVPANTIGGTDTRELGIKMQDIVVRSH